MRGIRRVLSRLLTVLVDPRAALGHLSVLRRTIFLGDRRCGLRTDILFALLTSSEVIDETARLHHAHRRRSGRVAARRARAAAGDAGDRIPFPRIARS